MTARPAPPSLPPSGHRRHRRGPGAHWPGPPPGWHGPPHRWRGPPVGHGARWWRRRFLRFFLVAGLIWIGVGVLINAVRGRDPVDDRRGPPPAIVVGVGAAVIATFVAYRRLARPMSELLDGAERIGAGEYDVRVQPSGPRSVRTLGHAFNDMASRLEASETARRRFLADVTHELRTPLTVLQAGIEAQLDGVHARDDERLEVLLDQTRTLDRLVEDLRTLALGDAGELVLHRESVSVGAVIADAVAALAAVAERRELTVEVEAPYETIVLEADPVRLRQVLTNVLTNALRHTPAGGRVTITIARDGDEVTVTVTDTGPGIQGDPERIFDRFARAADSGGSGLGLTIARQLVEAHGGTITATNALGAGARFTIRLPLS